MDSNLQEYKDELKKVNDSMMNYLQDFCNSGYLKLVASALVYTGKSADSLQNYSEEQKKSIKQFMDNSKITDDNVLETVSKMFALLNSDLTGLDLCHKLSMENSSKDVLEASLEYEKTNPILCNYLSSTNFLFEDFIYLDDRSVQKVLREVDQIELAKALKSTTKDVKDKIFRNMSKRAAAMLQEDMEFMGPMKFSEVFESQQKIVKIISRLEESGEVTIEKNGEVLVN